MWESKICRICLKSDGKMCNIKWSKLKEIYQSLSGITVEDRKYPQGICVECAHYLNMFSKFKTKCLTAYKIVQKFINNGEKITKSSLKAVDRKDNELATNLDYSREMNVTILTIIYDDSEISKTTIKRTDNVHVSFVNILPEAKRCDEMEPAEEVQDTVENLVGIDFDGKDDDDVGNVLDDVMAKDDDDEIVIKNDDIKDTELILEDTSEVENKDDIDVASDFPMSTRKTIAKRKHMNRKKEKVLKRIVRRKGGKTRADVELLRKYDGRYKRPRDIENDFVIEYFLTEDEQTVEFGKRRESANYLESRYRCDMCLKGFREQKLLDVHMRKHEKGSGDFLCTICQIRLSTSKRYRTHRDGNHTAKYMCKACDFVTFSKAQARNHHTWHQGVEHKCPHCDMTFRKYTTFMGHLRIIHPSQFICGSCAHSFVSPHGLNHHRKVVHKDEGVMSEGMEQTMCKECHVLFDSYRIYVKHILISPKHEDLAQNILGCRECGEEFQSAELMAKHKHKREDGELDLVTKQTARQVIHCPQCDDQFTHPNSVYQHFIKTHPNQPYKMARNRKDCLCEHCGKTFMCQSKLVAHRRLHTGERPYKCPQCPKTFRAQVYLSKHTDLHKGLRPHDCKICGKSFSNAGSLFKHMRIHSGVKPFKCEICEKAFVDSSNLKQHIQGVHYNVRRTRKR